MQTQEQQPVVLAVVKIELSNIVYPANLEVADEGGFVVTFRDIPEAITQGDNWSDMLAMAHDALSTAFEFYFEDNRPVPPPSAFQHSEVAIGVSVEDARMVEEHNRKLES